MDHPSDSGKSANLTIKDVARALNVSTTTVSRALSGKGRISEETVRRVQEYIREKNYVPNAIAQSLAGQRTCNIGFIVPEIEAISSQSFFLGCLAGICRELSDTPYDVLMLMEDGGGKLEQALEKGKLDGAVVARSQIDDQTTMKLRQMGVPFVLIGSAPEEFLWHVDHDNRTACAELTWQLLQSGQKLALLGGDRRLYVTQDRYQGFLDAHQEAYVPVDWDRLYFELDTVERTKAAVDAALKAGTGCLVCMDDRICSMVLSLLHHRELRIPQDIQVASFYDSFLLESYVPPITTLHFDAQKLGGAACRMLLDRLEGRNPRQLELVGYEVALRASTAEAG